MTRLRSGTFKAMTLPELETEMSTEQAAEMIAVSLPFFIKLLEQGELPYRKVGEQRRVRYQDVLAYQNAYRRKATIALNEMASEMQVLNLYD